MLIPVKETALEFDNSPERNHRFRETSHSPTRLVVLLIVVLCVGVVFAFAFFFVKCMCNMVAVHLCDSAFLK